MTNALWLLWNNPKSTVVSNWMEPKAMQMTGVSMMQLFEL